jgi:hypothetical protein
MNIELAKLKSDNETNRVITSQQNSSLFKMKEDMAKLYNDNNSLRNENVRKYFLNISFIVIFEV